MSFRILVVGASSDLERTISRLLADAYNGSLDVRFGSVEGHSIESEKADAILFAIGHDDDGQTVPEALLSGGSVPVVVLARIDDGAAGLEAIKHGAFEMVTLGIDERVRLPKIIGYLIEMKKLREAVSDEDQDEEDAVIIPMEAVKAMTVARALALCGGNINKTAARLGIARMTVYRLLDLYRNRN